MNASRVSSPPRPCFGLTRATGFMTAVVVACLVMAAAPGKARAQEAPPEASEPTSLPPPLQLRPHQQIAPAPAPLLPAPAEATPLASGAKVRTDVLQTINPDTVGTLTVEEGGLGIAMWSGTSRNLVDTLLPRLPVNAASAAMRSLMRRLLLSPAEAPRGESESGGLIALRIELLAAMGDLAGAHQLLTAIPKRDHNERLIRIDTDSRFLANDNHRACNLATRQIAERASSYWQKAFIFCQALAGEHQKAALGVSLLREMGAKDEVFFSLVEALALGAAADMESLPDPSPLHLAVARAAKARLPADVVSSNRPGILKTIATSPNASVELRLEAAERAEAMGSLAVDTLRQLYTSASFSDEELANPLSKAEAESGPLSRALLYRTSLVQTVPTAQAEVVARALSLAREGGLYASTVRVFLPLLKRIPPSDELVWFAPEAVRALFISGEHQAARIWFDLLRASSKYDKDAKDALAALLPVAHLAGYKDVDKWTTDRLIGWWRTIKESKEAGKRATLLYSLFDALGEKVPDEAWETLLEGPQRITVAMPHPALWYRLAFAANSSKAPAEREVVASVQPNILVNAEGVDVEAPLAAAQAAPGIGRRRLGETVLLSLLALGESGPGAADPVVLSRVLSSLGTIGMAAEARTLAIEAALAGGL